MNILSWIFCWTYFNLQPSKAEVLGYRLKYLFQMKAELVL